LAEKSLVLYREYAHQNRKICEKRRIGRQSRLTLPRFCFYDKDDRLGKVAQEELFNDLLDREG
jgi:hypothetical protein